MIFLPLQLLSMTDQTINLTNTINQLTDLYS
ncbi:hypothetical protein QE439_001247 [Pedobacter agri]|nr:hypothetical protein [Pedobacter agri]